MTASTIADVESQASRTPQRVRAAATVALFAVLAAALLGLLGTRVAERSVTESGWTTHVRFASAARAGLDIPLTVTVERAGGFDGDVTVAISSDYLRLLDQQSVDPEPAEQTRDGAWTYLTFTAPEGEVLRFDIEAYVRALHDRSASGRVTVIDPDGLHVAPVDIHTRIVP